MSDRTSPERVALIGVVVNAALAVTKLLAGILGHSFALVADAVESLVDIIGSAVVWGALRYGGRPADEEHPFGHGKIEALAGLAVALLIFAAGLGIAVEAGRQIVSPHESPRPFTLFVLIGVVVVKETMYQIAHRAATKTSSNAALSDAWHHRSDAITSAFAFAGITVALIGGPKWAPADDWAALLASGVIMYNGLRLCRGPFSELMDEHTPEVAERVREATLAMSDVKGVERCEVRRSGRGYRVVMHVEVDAQMSVAESHRLTGRVKQAIREQYSEVDSVLIHIEPFEGARAGVSSSSPNGSDDSNRAEG